MKCFFSCYVVFGEKLTPSVSPPFSKSENGGENLASSPPNSVFWNFGEAGGGLSLIQELTNFHFKISENSKFKVRKFMQNE